MTTRKITQNSFNTGQVGPFMDGRVDSQLYKTGLETCQIFVSGHSFLDTPSTTTIVFCKRSSGVCVGILNFSVISKSCANKFPPEISLID